MRKQAKSAAPVIFAIGTLVAVVLVVVFLNARNARKAAERERAYNEVANQIADFAESP